MPFRPQRRSQLLVFLFTASSLTAHRRTVRNDFSDYPSGAQQCLYDASNHSGCNGDTVPEINQCLCGNGGDFVTKSAKCVAEEDSDDLENTYKVMSLHCSDSKTPLSISKQDWMAEGSTVPSFTSSSKTSVSKTVSTSTIFTATTGKGLATTTTGPPNPTSTPDTDSNSGFPNGARVGIIVGSATAGAALFAAALFFCCRHRQRCNHTYEEVHHLGGQLPSNSMGEGATIFEVKGPGAAISNRTSIVPSDLENAIDHRKSWHPSSDGSQVPWSPGAFDVVKLHPGLGNLHRPPRDVFEMSTVNERPVSVSLSVAPVEMPIISDTSPTVSPTSRYSGDDCVEYRPQGLSI